MYHRDHRYGSRAGGAKKSNNTSNLNGTSTSNKSTGRVATSIVPTPFNLPSIRNSTKSRPGASAIRSAGSSWGSAGIGNRNIPGGNAGPQTDLSLGNGRPKDNANQKPVWGGNGVRAVTGKEALGRAKNIEQKEKKEEVESKNAAFAKKNTDNGIRHVSNDARVLNGTLNNDANTKPSDEPSAKGNPVGISRNKEEEKPEKTTPAIKLPEGDDWADEGDDTLDFSQPLSLAHNPEPEAPEPSHEAAPPTPPPLTRPQIIRSRPPPMRNAWNAGPNLAVNPRAAVRGAAYTGGYHQIQQRQPPLAGQPGYNEDELRTVTEMKELMRKKAEARAKQRMEEEEERMRKTREAAKRKLDELNARLAKRDAERKKKELVEKGLDDTTSVDRSGVVETQRPRPRVSQARVAPVASSQGQGSSIERPVRRYRALERPPLQRRGSPSLPPRDKQAESIQRVVPPRPLTEGAWQRKGPPHSLHQEAATQRQPELSGQQSMPSQQRRITPTTPSQTVPPSPQALEEVHKAGQNWQAGPAKSSTSAHERYHRPVIHPPNPTRRHYRGGRSHPYQYIPRDRNHRRDDDENGHPQRQGPPHGPSRQPYQRRTYHPHVAGHPGQPSHENQIRRPVQSHAYRPVSQATDGTGGEKASPVLDSRGSLGGNQVAANNRSPGPQSTRTAALGPPNAISPSMDKESQSIGTPAPTVRNGESKGETIPAAEGTRAAQKRSDVPVESVSAKGDNQGPRVLLRRPQDPNRKDDSKSSSGKAHAAQTTNGNARVPKKVLDRRNNAKGAGASAKPIAITPAWDPKVARKLSSFDEISRAFSNQSDKAPVEGGSLFPSVPVVAPLPPRLPVSRPLIPNGPGASTGGSAARGPRARTTNGRPPRPVMRTGTQGGRDDKETKLQKKARRLRQKEVAAKRRQAMADKSKNLSNRRTRQKSTDGKMSTESNLEARPSQSFSKTPGIRPAPKYSTNRVQREPLSTVPKNASRQDGVPVQKPVSKPVTKNRSFSDVAKASLPKEEESKPSKVLSSKTREDEKEIRKEPTVNTREGKQSETSETAKNSITNLKKTEKNNEKEVPRSRERRNARYDSGRGKSDTDEKRAIGTDDHQNGGGHRRRWKVKPKNSKKEHVLVRKGSPKSVADNVHESPERVVDQGPPRSSLKEAKTNEKPENPGSEERYSAANQKAANVPSQSSSSAKRENGTKPTTRRSFRRKSNGTNKSKGNVSNEGRGPSKNTTPSLNSIKSEVEAKPTKEEPVATAAEAVDTRTTKTPVKGKKVNEAKGADIVLPVVNDTKEVDAANAKPEEHASLTKVPASSKEGSMNGHYNSNKRYGNGRGRGRGRVRGRGRGRGRGYGYGSRGGRGRERGNSVGNRYDEDSGKKTVWKAKSSPAVATD